MRAVFLADRVFELFAIALITGALSMEAADPRQAETAADLYVVAAREILILFVVQPPRHVDVHAADSVRVMTWQPFQRGNVAGQTVSGGIGQIATHHPGRVRQPVGKTRGFRI